MNLGGKKAQSLGFAKQEEVIKIRTVVVVWKIEKKVQILNLSLT